MAQHIPTAEQIVRNQIAKASPGGCWIHPEKILRSWRRRNDDALQPEQREYHRSVARLGVRILQERKREVA